MTWKNEKSRHSMAARGISTKQNWKPAKETVDYPFDAIHLYGDFYAVKEEDWISLPVTLKGYSDIREGDYQPMGDQEEGDDFLNWVQKQPEYDYKNDTWNGKKIEIMESMGGPYGVLIGPESGFTTKDIIDMVSKYKK